VTEASEYTFRYLNAEGRFVAVVQAECTGVRAAVCMAVRFLAEEYAALEISQGEEAVWQGLREDALRIAASG
jgi:hypothetical protein